MMSLIQLSFTTRNSLSPKNFHKGHLSVSVLEKGLNRPRISSGERS